MPAPTPVDVLDCLGTMIRTARKERGLSQDELAAKLGVVQSRVSAIERGSAVDIDAALIVLLEQTLGLDARTVAHAAADRVTARVSVDSKKSRHSSSLTP
jgi:transcriptional regulator with XRE-family HTH domain